MESLDIKWLVDHGVCVVAVIVIYFWRIEPLLTDITTKLAVLIDRVPNQLTNRESTK